MIQVSVLNTNNNKIVSRHCLLNGGRQFGHRKRPVFRGSLYVLRYNSSRENQIKSKRRGDLDYTSHDIVTYYYYTAGAGVQLARARSPIPVDDCIILLSSLNQVHRVRRRLALAVIEYESYRRASFCPGDVHALCAGPVLSGRL